MNEKEKLALSFFGILLLLAGFFCAKDAVSLILFAWDMTSSLGFREVLGYWVVTSVVVCLSTLIVPLVLLIGIDMTIGSWRGDSKS